MPQDESNTPKKDVPVTEEPSETVEETKPKEHGATDKYNPTQTQVPAPSGVDKSLWDQAVHATLGKNGGFAGVGPEGRERQVRQTYDQMVSNGKQSEEWAGEGGGVLGDTK